MTLVGRKKITHGWVTQTFDDNGKCIAQEFFAGDVVEFEDEDGNPIEPWSEYHCFDMVQPDDNARIDAIGEKLTAIINALAARFGLSPVAHDDPEIELRLTALKAKLDAVKLRAHVPDCEQVTCKFCHQQVLRKNAYLHDDGQYVGDCCWDERLRSSE